jgi:hypothetical protein
MSGAIVPITAGGAVAGMGTTAGVLYALGVSLLRSGRVARAA